MAAARSKLLLYESTITPGAAPGRHWQPRPTGKTSNGPILRRIPAAFGATAGLVAALAQAESSQGATPSVAAAASSWRRCGCCGWASFEWEGLMGDMVVPL